MLARVLVCNYAREYHQTWMAALVVYLKLLRRIQLLNAPYLVIDAMCFLDMHI